MTLVPSMTLVYVKEEEPPEEEEPPPEPEKQIVPPVVSPPRLIVAKITDGNGRHQSTGKKRKLVKFSERIEQLLAYKAIHGHVNVRELEDSGLNEFCKSMRTARRGKGGSKLTVARLAALNALGFDWKLPPGVEGRLSGVDGGERGGDDITDEQIKKWSQQTEAQTRGGCLPGDLTQAHTLLPLGEDGANVGDHGSGGKCTIGYSLRLCATMASHGEYLPSDQQTHSHSLLPLGELGLGGVGEATNNRKRGKPKVDFEDRIEQLRIFKAHFGHLNVREKLDKKLYEFCRRTRRGRRGKGSAKITKERIAALDAIGFDWKLTKETALSCSDDVGNIDSNQKLSNEESLMEIEQQQEVGGEIRVDNNSSSADTRLLLTHALRQLANMSSENDRRHSVMQHQLATLTETITQIAASLPSTETAPPTSLT
jgi:hypothetical protein